MRCGAYAVDDGRRRAEDEHDERDLHDVETWRTSSTMCTTRTTSTSTSTSASTSTSTSTCAAPTVNMAAQRRRDDVITTAKHGRDVPEERRRR